MAFLDKFQKACVNTIEKRANEMLDAAERDAKAKELRARVYAKNSNLTDEQRKKASRAQEYYSNRLDEIEKRRNNIKNR